MGTYTGVNNPFSDDNLELRRIAWIASVSPTWLAAALNNPANLTAYIPSAKLAVALATGYGAGVDFFSMSATQLVNAAYWLIVRGTTHLSSTDLNMGPAS